jgi:hypothetical protein
VKTKRGARRNSSKTIRQDFSQADAGAVQMLRPPELEAESAPPTSELAPNSATEESPLLSFDVKLLNLNANLALAGVNGSGKSNSV